MERIGGHSSLTMKGCLSENQIYHVIKRLQESIKIMDDSIVQSSSDLADVAHHKKCKFDCCGEHDETKMPRH